MEKVQTVKTGIVNECPGMTNQLVSEGIAFRAHLVYQEQRILALTFQDWEGPKMRDQFLEECTKQVLEPHLWAVTSIQLKRKNRGLENFQLY